MTTKETLVDNIYERILKNDTELSESDFVRTTTDDLYSSIESVVDEYSKAGVLIFTESTNGGKNEASNGGKPM